MLAYKAGEHVRRRKTQGQRKKGQEVVNGGQGMQLRSEEEAGEDPRALQILTAFLWWVCTHLSTPDR